MIHPKRFRFSAPSEPRIRPLSNATRKPAMNSYASLCDDFGVSTYVHGKLEMPTGRETVLHFFEAVQKALPKMTEFEKRGENDYMLEEDRESGNSRWTSVDARRLCAGFVNPPALEDAD